MRSLLRQQLGQKINVEILEKALTLELHAVRGLRALRQADARAARGVVAAAVAGHADVRARRRACVTLVGYGALLAAFSPIALAVLVAAAIPPFVAELKFSGDAFRLSRWRTPETREQIYLETVLAREDHAKEVKLFGLGPRFLERYRAIFDEAVRGRSRAHDPARGLGRSCSARSARLAFYGMYLWIAIDDDRRRDHDRRDDDVRRRRSSRRSRRCRARSATSAACTRTTCTCRTSTSSSRRRRSTPTGTRDRRARSRGDGVRFENVTFQLPGLARAGARATSTCTSRRAASSRSSARTAPARPR